MATLTVPDEAAELSFAQVPPAASDLGPPMRQEPVFNEAMRSRRLNDMMRRRHDDPHVGRVGRICHEDYLTIEQCEVLFWLLHDCTSSTESTCLDQTYDNVESFLKAIFKNWDSNMAVSPLPQLNIHEAVTDTVGILQSKSPINSTHSSTHQFFIA